MAVESRLDRKGWLAIAVVRRPGGECLQWGRAADGPSGRWLASKGLADRDAWRGGSSLSWFLRGLFFAGSAAADLAVQEFWAPFHV